MIYFVSDKTKLIAVITSVMADITKEQIASLLGHSCCSKFSFFDIIFLLLFYSTIHETSMLLSMLIVSGDNCDAKELPLPSAKHILCAIGSMISSSS